MSSLEASKLLIQELETTGLSDVRSYSGRGMFGRECVAIVVESDTDLWEIARSVPTEVYLPAPRSDNIGLDMVYYWPSYKWPEEEKV